ncbi:MAG: response regulator, partial [Oculatellaceae cyanobacterium Prado106]|nr:response regulator [Oculatellaceae cyanobacterium Prado106]
VEIANNGQLGWEMVQAFEYDLLLLDVLLPQLDGISFCKQVRSQGYQMPILLLTGLADHHDKALGLDAGADDYVVKPFDPEELTARIRALLRRVSSSLQPLLEWGNLQLDPISCEVQYANHLLSLTPKEYALLELFLRNHRRVFSCGDILEHLWAYEDVPGEEAVRTHIKGLRQKLKAAGAPDVVETVYGIGYRLRPLEHLPLSTEAQKPSSSVSSSSGSSTQPQILSLIGGVWHRFRPRIDEQIAVLEQAVSSLSNETWNPELQQQALQEAHTLAGALGTFGLSEGTRLAREIESDLKEGQGLKKKQIQRLGDRVTSLRQNIEQNGNLPASAPVVPMQLSDSRPLLMVVERDQPFAESIGNAAESWGMRVAIAADFLEARQMLNRIQPQAVLLDLEEAEHYSVGLNLITELSRQVPPVPVLAFAGQSGLAERLEILRCGGRTLLQKPILPEQVFEAVARVLRRNEVMQSKVLVVDDDPRILSILSNLLEPWGLKIIPLSDPQKFLETMESTLPDLLVLDVEMPEVSGLELCQVVRNDLRWSNLPILFLTAHTDPNTVSEVFAGGADDFVSKPIVGPELVTRILNRLERTKLLRRLAEIDPLTGTLNRQKSNQELEDFLRSAARLRQPMAIALLDIDQLRLVNNQYGHEMGDTVLRQLGHLLRMTFHSEDIVGRWGGEEFMIGMYGMTKSDAVQRLTHLLESVQKQTFTMSGDHALQITCSAGVAEYPQDGSDLQVLCRTADRRLRRVKQAGVTGIGSENDP